MPVDRIAILAYSIDMGEEETTKGTSQGEKPEEKQQIIGAETATPDFRMILGPKDVGLKFSIDGGKMELALPMGKLTELDVQTVLASLETAMIPFEELLQKFHGKKETAVLEN